MLLLSSLFILLSMLLWVPSVFFNVTVIIFGVVVGVAVVVTIVVVVVGVVVGGIASRPASQWCY